MAAILETLIEYFDLRVSESDFDTVRGGRHGRGQRTSASQKRGAWWWNLVIYLLIVAGVIGKFFFDYWQQTRIITGLDLGISFVIGALVFPAIYKSTNMSPDKPDLLQSFLAFQNGFFWQTLVGGLLH